MEVPESIPIPLVPEVQKNLTPAAVKRSEPPFFDPEREGSEDGHRKKRRKHRQADPDTSEPDGESQPDESDRGTRINIRA